MSLAKIARLTDEAHEGVRPGSTVMPTDWADPPGKLGDLMAYPADPLVADLDDLAELVSAFTIVGGRAAHEPGGSRAQSPPA